MDPQNASPLAASPASQFEETADSQGAVQNPWLVLDFCDVSVVNFAENIVRIIKRQHAVERRRRSNRDIVKAIHIHQLELTESLFYNPTFFDNYRTLISVEHDDLINIWDYVQGFEVLDKIVRICENLNCIFITALLQDRGVNAQYVEVSHGMFPGAWKSLTDEFYTEFSPAISQNVIVCGNHAPATTSYFEAAMTGDLTHAMDMSLAQLYTAHIVTTLDARGLQIWTEVGGFFTVNPPIVPGARPIHFVTSVEATQLAILGSGAIRAPVIEEVFRARIPISINNVTTPYDRGTVISTDREEDLQSFGMPTSPNVGCESLVRNRSALGMTLKSHLQRPTAIAVKNGLLMVNIHSNRSTRAHEFLMNVFRIFNKWHLSMGLISSSEVHVSAALSMQARPFGADEELTFAITELSHYGNVEVKPSMTIISLVAHHSRTVTEVSATLFSVLGDNGINIEMISQVASKGTVACVIRERDEKKALNRLHAEFFFYPN
ncbi:aspartate kinase [Fusarium albosuccineum]|uniref:aspartate kinase n=1 Tax=Fusarium albosuccineum TaxID=1237068 RepID=A0A8H4KRK9_9HYPO|nr:aspartate kinase [Fusarium albosuccineum]